MEALDQAEQIVGSTDEAPAESGDLVKIEDAPRVFLDSLAEVRKAAEQWEALGEAS